MYISRDKMAIDYKEKLRDGEGTVKFTRLAPLDAAGRLTLFSEVCLPAGASIGYHRHDGETEYYIFVSGTGVVNDNGTDYPVKAGDVTVTGDGCSHSLSNTGSDDLVLYAMIVRD
jgi:mannose-6-phosphate isomerase-like protein (cupin superfamily)